jgi:hypothetical protein
VEITCHHCRTTFEVPAGTMLSARLKFAFGSKEYSFTCPHCGVGNVLSDDQFHSNDKPQIVVPVTGSESLPGDSDRQLVGRAPTNPIENPAPPSQQQYQAVVRARGVDARRDHNLTAEIVGVFSSGETVTILDTWSDGKDTWVKLGPERWINLEQDGEPVLELNDGS